MIYFLTFFVYFCLFLGETGDAEKTIASHPTAFQETGQLALSTAPVNQATFQANPVQRYIANQPYFNPFTGKSAMSQYINRPMSGFSSLTSKQANTVLNRYAIFPAVSTLVNGYLKDSTFRYPNDGITHSFHNIETGQALPTNPYSYLRPPVKTTQSDNFQLPQYSFLKPVSTNVAKDPAFRSPSYSTFYPHPHLLGKGRKISPAKDKVVTEGELNEKGLLSDILSRDHIGRKPGAHH